MARSRTAVGTFVPALRRATTPERRLARFIPSSVCIRTPAVASCTWGDAATPTSKDYQSLTLRRCSTSLVACHCCPAHLVPQLAHRQSRRLGQSLYDASAQCLRSRIPADHAPDSDQGVTPRRSLSDPKAADTPEIVATCRAILSSPALARTRGRRPPSGGKHTMTPSQARTFSRRRVLKSVGSVAAAATLPIGAAPASTPRRRLLPRPPISRDA